MPACSLTDNTAVGYTGVFNILDYSCVSFPTGMLADKDIDKPLKDGYKPLSNDCGTIHSECEAIKHLFSYLFLFFLHPTLHSGTMPC